MINKCDDCKNKKKVGTNEICDMDNINVFGRMVISYCKDFEDKKQPEHKISNE